MIFYSFFQKPEISPGPAGFPDPPSGESNGRPLHQKGSTDSFTPKCFIFCYLRMKSPSFLPGIISVAIFAIGMFKINCILSDIY